MGTDFTYTDARLDSRDLLDRLDELEAARDAFVDERITETVGPGELETWWAEDHPEDADELDMLRALRDETEGYADDSWRDGVFFVANWDWKNYAQELAEDIGALPKDAGWPTYCIDWDAAARDLRMDYTSCEIDGNTYWYR